MNPKKPATPAHPVQDLITQRWSPYAFSDRPVSEETSRSLFEAARWAASSYNAAALRYIVATKATPAEFERLLVRLVEEIRRRRRPRRCWPWAASGLQLVLNGRPNSAAEHDLGLASATSRSRRRPAAWCVDQMIGILPEKARELYRVRTSFRPLTGLAIGYAASPRYAPGESPPAQSARPNPQAARRVRLRRPMGNAVRPREMKPPRPRGHCPMFDQFFGAHACVMQ